MSLGRYEVLGELGTNGAGVMHLALDRERGKRVAIELIEPRLAAEPEFARRLRARAELLMQRRHPNVARIDEADESPDGCPYVVMEVVEGRPLADSITERAPLSADDGVAILLQIALGVQHLHEQGITPLRLRPDSVMIGARDHVTLMPSSLLPEPAHAAPVEPASGDTLYLAPEEMRGEPAGQAADVYRLGLIAYELFSGRRPFEGTGEALIEAQLYASPPPLVRFNSDLPGPVTRAIQRALAKSPEARPAGAAAFADLLLGAEPEPMRPSETISETTAAASPGTNPAESRDASVGADPRARAAAAVEAQEREPATSLPSAVPETESTPARRRARARWLALGVVLAAVVVVALVVLALKGRGGKASPAILAPLAVTPAAAAATTPVATPVATVALPMISELTVCNDVFACKQTNFVVSQSVAVCFVLAATQGGAPLLAVVTAGGNRPADANAPEVIARSAPISGAQQRSCYLVALPDALAPGPYTAWVLVGSAILGQRDFTTVAR